MNIFLQYKNEVKGVRIPKGMTSMSLKTIISDMFADSLAKHPPTTSNGSAPPSTTNLPTTTPPTPALSSLISLATLATSSGASSSLSNNGNPTTSSETNNSVPGQQIMFPLYIPKRIIDKNRINWDLDYVDDILANLPANTYDTAYDVHFTEVNKDLELKKQIEELATSSASSPPTLDISPTHSSASNGLSNSMLPGLSRDSSDTKAVKSSSPVHSTVSSATTVASTPNAAIPKNKRKKGPRDKDKIRETNPNYYYYLWRDPNQIKNDGAWTDEEKRQFMDAYQKYGTMGGKWGLFSQFVPTRNGRQCLFYYRSLVKEGVLQATDNGTADTPTCPDSDQEDEAPVPTTSTHTPFLPAPSKPVATPMVTSQVTKPTAKKPRLMSPFVSNGEDLGSIQLKSERRLSFNSFEFPGSSLYSTPGPISVSTTVTASSNHGPTDVQYPPHIAYQQPPIRVIQQPMHFQSSQPQQSQVSPPHHSHSISHSHSHQQQQQQQQPQTHQPSSLSSLTGSHMSSLPPAPQFSQSHPLAFLQHYTLGSLANEPASAAQSSYRDEQHHLAPISTGSRSSLSVGSNSSFSSPIRRHFVRPSDMEQDSASTDSHQHSNGSSGSTSNISSHTGNNGSGSNNSSNTRQPHSFSPLSLSNRMPATLNGQSASATTGSSSTDTADQAASQQSWLRSGIDLRTPSTVKSENEY